METLELFETKNESKIDHSKKRESIICQILYFAQIKANYIEIKPIVDGMDCQTFLKFHMFIITTARIWKVNNKIREDFEDDFFCWLVDVARISNLDFFEIK